MSMVEDAYMNAPLSSSALSRTLTAVLNSAVVFGVFSFFRLAVARILMNPQINAITGEGPETARMLSFLVAGGAGIVSQFLLARKGADTLKACFGLNLPRVGTFVIWGGIGIVFGVLQRESWDRFVRRRSIRPAPASTGS